MSSQWVDQPYSLICTDPFSKDSSHAAYYVATQMALAHNGILRGLNSIYLQSTQIPREDLDATRDFLTYCQCWCESMHHHHDAEEKDFFPGIERISEVQGIMDRNIEQHRAFTPGFDRFQEHSRTCLPEDYDGRKIRSLIEAFAEPLTQHLHEEIQTLRDLDMYDSGRIRQAYRRLEKSLMATDNYRIAPLVFGTADRNFEGGMHDFPSVPFFVPYIIHYLFAKRHRGAWRFNPCTIWRDRRELAFPDWLSEQPVDNREENKDGTSPLDIAAQFGHLEVAEWLKEQEVEVSEKDSPYSTGFRYYSHSGILPGNNFNDFIIYVKAQNNPHAIIGVHEMIFC